MMSRTPTGVIVALVVFVVLSVALLAISIILYTGQSAAEKRESEARAELAAFITTGELGRSDVQAMRTSAGSQSLYGYMSEQGANIGEFVVGDRGANLSKMRTDLGVAEGQTVREAMRKVMQDRDARSQEAASLRTRTNELDKEIQSLKTRLADAEKARTAAIAQVTASIDSYKQAADGYRTSFEAAKAALDQSRADLTSRYEGEIGALQSDLDGLRAERSVLNGRVAALQRKVEASATKAGNPAALVDARVVDVDAKTGTLFIDIGANKRVVPGMTFEVFDDAAGIVASADTGSRGKASVQVIKVGEATSTCRVLRGAASRPIVKDDVLANAVFNPDYRFKFMVHGKFDANGDGKATVGEADYVKSRILEWGGEVIDGDTLVGDLDFLVLGVEPPMPIALAGDASEAQILSYIDQRAARELYRELFRTASDAQIPVLNWTRFEALTGTVNR
jgi:hypothetical protein